MDFYNPIGIFALIISIMHLSFMLRLRQGLSREPAGGIAKETPSVSVIISLHNEAENIPPLIQCLKNMDYPADRLEFILVNDRSTDRSEELLRRSIGSDRSFKVFQVNDIQPGFAPKKYAIDLAIGHARGQIILLTDADGRPGPAWIRSMVSQFNRETGMVLGHAPYSTGGHPGRMAYNLMKIEYFSHAAISAATTGLGYPATCVGTNLAYRRSVYTGLEGFGPMRHIHTGDDDLFLQRVRDETSWEIRYAFDPESFVPNAPPDNWKQFYHQRLRYASKSFNYPFRFTLILSGYYLYNLFLLFLLISVVFGAVPCTMVVLTLALKLIGEYLFLRTASSVFRYPLPAWLIPLAGLFHIPYVIYFGLMANFRRFEWGGLRQRAGV